jgi:hypothetical protein
VVGKQLQNLKMDMVLFLDTQLKPHMMFYIPNYDIYWTEEELEVGI